MVAQALPLLFSTGQHNKHVHTFAGESWHPTTLFTYKAYLSIKTLMVDISTLYFLI